MMYKLTFGLFLLLLAFSSKSQELEVRNPKLILQITVDQLRADLPATVYDRLPEGGFKYLYEKGIVYENAHHRHANTETVVGHATLVTVAQPNKNQLFGFMFAPRVQWTFHIKEMGLNILNVLKLFK